MSSRRWICSRNLYSEVLQVNVLKTARIYAQYQKNANMKSYIN